MIITLELECLPHPFCEDEYKRTFEIDDCLTMEQLHLCLQDILHFENDHMYEFYIARNPHGAREVTICNEEVSFHEETLDIEETELNEVFPLERKQNLYYLFDFGDSWLFRLKRTRHKEKNPEKGVLYPRIIKSIGDALEQYPEWDDE